VKIEQQRLSVLALARIKTSYGDIGLNVHVEAGAQVTLSDVIVSENQIGIRAFGEGDVAISGSCAVGNSYANAMLGAAAVDVQDSEFLLSFVGIVLVGNVEAILSQNIIGLGKSGLLTYTQSCGFNFFGVPQTFTGKVSGVGNRVYGHMLDLCPSHEFWPDEFVDTNWRLTIWRVLTLSAQAEAEFEAQDYVSAVRSLEKCLSLFAFSRFPYLEGQLLRSLAAAYNARGQHKKALEILPAARKLLVDRGLDVEVAMVDGNTGVAYEGLRQYEEALSMYRGSRAVFASQGMMADVTMIAHNIGNVYLNLGRYEEALDAYQSTRAMYVSDNMDIDVAKADGSIGNVYRLLGLYDRALEIYNSAYTVFARHRLDVDMAKIKSNMGILHAELGQYEQALLAFAGAQEIYTRRGMDVDAAKMNQNRGNVYLDLGQYEEAIDAYRFARATYVEQEMEVDIADADQSIGNVYSELGQYEEALLKYEEALELLDAITPLSDMPFSCPVLRYMICSNKGTAQEGLTHWDKAISSYKQAIAMIESIRGSFTSEEIKIAWQEHTQDVYERLIDLLYRMGEGSSAFTYAERCRARTFLDLLAIGPINALENVTEEGIRTGVVDASVIETDLAMVVAELPDDTAALEYFVTDSATYLWVVHRGEIQGPLQLPVGRESLMDQVIACRQAIESQDPMADFYLATLYSALIAPVENLLPASDGGEIVSHLVIVPSGPLYYLPFQALLRVSENREERQRLIERYTLSYTPSLVTLKYTQQQRTSLDDVSFLALADPSSGDPRLPEAQTESRRIASLFSVSEVYVDDAATELVVQARAAVATNVLLSTHGLFNSHNAMFSYLVLDPDEDSDGRLYTHEVFGLPLSANLVVLSACETLFPSMADMEGQIRAVRAASDDEPIELTEEQLATLTSGDEIAGLTRAFLYAGSSSVLSSLWSVYSQTTADLMVAFYEGIQAGKDKATALREAQLLIMSTSGHEQPAYWAAFNLMGDWR